MRLLVDENFSGRVAHGLREAGWEVELVRSIEVGMPDRRVLATSVDSGALLLTEDSDFSELVFRDHHASVGVLYVRLDGVSIDRRIAIVTDILTEYRDRLLGCFTVIDHGGYRIRQRRLDEDRL